MYAPGFLMNPSNAAVSRACPFACLYLGHHLNTFPPKCLALTNEKSNFSAQTQENKTNILKQLKNTKRKIDDTHHIILFINRLYY